MAFGIDDGIKAAGAVIPIISNAFGIGEKRQDKRQIKQQTALQELGIKGSKELTDYNKAKELEMWKATNWSAQMEEAEKAGLSTAYLYGKGGGTTGTVGSGGAGMSVGGAADAASAMNAGTNQAMAIAQLQNLQANTKKTNAEAENIAPTGEKIKADTELTKWNTELSKKLNSDSMIKDVQEQQKYAAIRLEQSQRRELQEWEAWEAGSLTDSNGKKYLMDDPESPIAKAIRAGYSETVQQVENLKQTGDILESEKAIKRFEANLTRQGIAAGSPWYVKMVGDLLKKLGINLTGDTAGGAEIAGKMAEKAIKQAIKK